MRCDIGVVGCYREAVRINDPLENSINFFCFWKPSLLGFSLIDEIPSEAYEIIYFATTEIIEYLKTLSYISQIHKRNTLFFWTASLTVVHSGNMQFQYLFS